MTTPATGGGGVDEWVERAGRWAAARLTRRSFISRLGRTALVVAGGAAASTLMAEPAGARVCGQTGVSPSCPDFDCTDIWGWCWYSTGCCAGGLLKKICDCCAPNWPNVHGYCPTGTNVRCIVESCGEDPRVQRVRTTRLTTDDPGAMAASIRAAKFPTGNGSIVVGDSQDPLFGAVAIALAAMIEAPVILLPRRALAPTEAAEIQRLGSSAFLASPLLPPAADQELDSRGVWVHRVGTSEDLVSFSGEVAAWVADRLGGRDVVAVGAAEAPPVRALATSFAATLRLPLVYRPETLAGAGVALVGAEMAARRAEFPSAPVFPGPDQVDLSLQLAETVAGGLAGTIVLAPRDSPVLLALAAFGAPVLVHEHDNAARLLPFLMAHRGKITRAWLGGHRGSFGSPAYRQVQSALNGYEIHQLIGVAGQGLPVYSQPLAERVVGAARRGTDPPPYRLASRPWGQAGR